MDDHAKIRRVVTLLLLLSGGRNYSIQEVCSRLDISERTFHRYISTFKMAGLIVESENGRYRIRKIEPRLKELSQLVHFSEEEALILNKAILAIDDNNLMKSNLIKKLFAIYDFDRVADTIVRPEQSLHIHQLLNAIRAKKQVILKDYSSAHGKIVRDRCVEPFYFTTNYQMIWVFDPESFKCKEFKVARMTGVEITENSWQHEEKHTKLPMDPFRISGEEQTRIVLKLNLRAYNLMMEEYPLSELYLKKISDTEYSYDGPVCGLEGVGRFCLGLSDDVEILKPFELQKYVEAKAKRVIARRIHKYTGSE